MSKVKRSDVDGTVPGVCVSVIVRMNPDDGQPIVVSADRYAEPDFPDPHQTATRLWESIKGDWPGCQHAVTMNERARYLMACRNMRAVLGEGMTVEEYMETVK